MNRHRDMVDGMGQLCAVDACASQHILDFGVNYIDSNSMRPLCICKLNEQTIKCLNEFTKIQLPVNIN